MNDAKILFALNGYRPYESPKSFCVWFLIRESDNEHIFRDSCGTIGRTNHPVTDLTQIEWDDVPNCVVEAMLVYMK